MRKSNEVLSWLRSGNSAEKIRENFANLGVSYLLVNTERFLKLVHPMLTPEQVRVWNSFTQNNLSLAFEARGYSLWVIR